jgi:hypothetical protein
VLDSKGSGIAVSSGMLNADQHGLYAAPDTGIGVIKKSSWS